LLSLLAPNVDRSFFFLATRLSLLINKPPDLAPPQNGLTPRPTGVGPVYALLIWGKKILGLSSWIKGRSRGFNSTYAGNCDSCTFDSVEEKVVLSERDEASSLR
jgi:hypothetical protein